MPSGTLRAEEDFSPIIGREYQGVGGFVSDWRECEDNDPTIYWSDITDPAVHHHCGYGVIISALLGPDED